MRRLLKPIRAVMLPLLVAASASCGSVVRSGRAPVYLVIDSLQGSRGGPTPGPFASGLLDSDVITGKQIFGDAGQVILHTNLKDIGTDTNPAQPTANNEVTITRYHVEYVRTDGRNTPGVDVPYAFDGATTGTVPTTGGVTLGFELVRNIAKQQAPLMQLQTSPTILQTIANVTFYGQDQMGNELNVTGSITIEFGNFGDIQ